MSGSRSLRVLLVGPIPPEWGGKPTFGGAATFHRTFIEELLRGRQTYGLNIAGLIPTNFDLASGQHPPVPILRPTDKLRGPILYETALSITRPDIVIFQGIAYPWALYHSRNGHGVPMVEVVHTWNHVKRNEGRVAQRFRAIFEATLSAAALVVMPSPHMYVEGEYLGFTYPARTKIIPNPLSPLFLQEVDVSQLQRSGVLFASRLVPYKNPAALVALAATSDIKVTFVGDGPEKAILQAEVARLGIGDQVHFTGFLPFEQVRALMLQAEVLCVPSAPQSFGLVYIEALACGTPVVGPEVNVANIGGQLGTRCGEGVSSMEPWEVSAALARVRSSAWDRQELRRRAVAAFSPSTIIGKYVEAIRSAI